MAFSKVTFTFTFNIFDICILTYITRCTCEALDILEKIGLCMVDDINQYGWKMSLKAR
jgi:hypothetical protein